MPHIDAASHARIHASNHLQHIQRRMPYLILRTVIVDGEPYVVLLHKLLDARKSFRRRISGDNDLNPRALAVLELTADVVVFIFGKINGAGGMELNACCMVVVERFRLCRWIHGEVIFHVLGIQRIHVQLLHVADQLRPVEIAKGVAGTSPVGPGMFCHSLAAALQPARRSR